ncbi:MAG: hypothetical protein WCY11_13790 [Novosphingobium sp.]
MKKIVHLGLAGMAVLALTACGSADKASEAAIADDVEMPAEETVSTIDAAATPVVDASAVPGAEAAATASATDAAPTDAATQAATEVPPSGGDKAVGGPEGPKAQ